MLQVAASTEAGEGPRSSTASFTFAPTSKIGAAVVAIGGAYTAARGAWLILPCSAVGDSPLQTAWYHDGLQLNDWYISYQYSFTSFYTNIHS